MTDLSPAAQAVLDAAFPVYNDEETLYFVTGEQHAGHIAAAALRAAADQVAPHLEEPDWGACNNGHCDIELYTDHQRKRAKLLAIAAELETSTADNR